MTNIVPAAPGYFVVIATIDFADDDTPHLVEDRMWPVLAWRQQKQQARLEPVTLVDLQEHWCVVTPEGVVVDNAGRDFSRVADWRIGIVQRAAAAEAARNAIGEIIEAMPMT